MGVYIKGMEMPKNCMLCPLCVEEADQTNGEMCMVTGKLMPHCNHERLMDCPLIEIKPHGRLIDADALAEDLKRQCEEVFKCDAVSPDDFWITRNQAYNERLWKTWCESFYKYLESSPTIIPASDEDTNVLSKEETKT